MDLQPKTESNYPREQGKLSTKLTNPAAPRMQYVIDGFQRIWKNPLIYVLGTLVLMVAGYAVYLPGSILQLFLFPEQQLGKFTVQSYAISTAISLIPSMLSQMFLLGLSVATIEEMDTDTTIFQTLFGGFRNGMNVFLTIVVTWFAFYAGFAAVAVPLYFVFGLTAPFFLGSLVLGAAVTVVVLGLTSFAPLICIYENENWIGALVRSVRVSKKDWLGLGTVYMVAILSNFFGLLACCVGVLVTLPLMYVVQAMHYRDYRLTYLNQNGLPKV